MAPLGSTGGQFALPGPLNLPPEEEALQLIAELRKRGMTAQADELQARVDRGEFAGQTSSPLPPRLEGFIQDNLDKLFGEEEAPPEVATSAADRRLISEALESVGIEVSATTVALYAPVVAALREAEFLDQQIVAQVASQAAADLESQNVPGVVGSGSPIGDGGGGLGGGSFGDPIGWDNDGNLWSRSETDVDGIQYFRGGKLVDISNPVMSASLRQATINGADGVGGPGRDPGLAEGTRLDNLIKQRTLNSNPNLTTVTDERTGESFALDTVTGERTSLGRFGFAGIDPERDFQQARGVNQAAINQNVGQEDRLRRGLEQSAQISNQATDVQRFDRLQDILRNPSDFIARAFLQRGVQSPTGQISHADLVNALRGEIRDVDAPNFKTTLEAMGVDLSAAEFQPQPAAIEPTRNTATSGGLTNEKVEEFLNPKNIPADIQRVLGLKPTDSIADPTFSAANEETNFAESIGQSPAPAPKPRFNFQEQNLDEFSHGGSTRLGKFLVGDSPNGGTNSTTEMIINPTNAPIGVVANKDLKKKKGLARFGLGTFSNVTQQQLIGDAQRLSPPAVSSLFDQTPVPPLDFGFNLFTPNQTNQLTSAEQEALNSRLGVEFNTTLQDVVEGQRQRFGRTRERGRGRLQL